MNEIGVEPPRPVPSDHVLRRTAAHPPARRSILLASVLLIAAGGAAIGLWQPWVRPMQGVAPAPPGNAAPLVTTARVGPRPMTRYLAVAGSLVARHDMPVGVTASGSIEAVLADVGDHVAQGQVLARLDAAVLQAQLRHAQAAVQAASGAATAAQAAFRRVDGIRGTGAVSAEQIGQRQADATAAQARLAEAQAEANEIEARLAALVVRAPAAGVIAARHAEPGAVVGPGGPPLFELIEGGTIDFDAAVPQEELAALQPGLPVQLSLDAPAGTAGTTITGHIRSIAPSLDPHTRLGLVHVELPHDQRLRPGAFVQGRILLSHATVLAVPVSAVLWQDGSSAVYVVADGRAQRRSVQTGAVQDGQVTIQSGLAPGDMIVLSAGAFLHDGEAVRQVPAGSPAP